MKIAIAIQRQADVGRYYDLPLDTLSMAAMLKTAGNEVSYINCNDCHGSYEAILKDNLGDAEVVAFNAASTEYNEISALLIGLRKVNENIKIIGGGDLVSSDPDLILEALKLDVALVGEVEMTCLAAIEMLKQGKNPIKLNFSDNKGCDLDTLPIPDYTDFGLDMWLGRQRPSDTYYLYPLDSPRCIPFFTSRGLPFTDKMQYDWHERSYSRKSKQRIEGEIGFLKENFDFNMLRITDRYFNPDSEVLKVLAASGLKWSCTLPVEFAKPDKLKELKEAGCYLCDYDIQSFVTDILKDIGRNYTGQDAMNAMEWTHTVGMGARTRVYYGQPAECWRSFAYNLRLAMAHKDWHLEFRAALLHPGSESFLEAVDNKALDYPIHYYEQGCPCVNMTAMPQYQYQAIDTTLK